MEFPCKLTYNLAEVIREKARENSVIIKFEFQRKVALEETQGRHIKFDNGWRFHGIHRILKIPLESKKRKILTKIFN